MARARNIKPSFFTNDELAEVHPLGRLLFIALWTMADREGRLEDRPRRIKAEALPYDDADADALLNDLQQHGFILRYEVGGARYIQVLAFTKHQNPHIKEAESTIPAPGSTVQAPDEHGASTVEDTTQTGTSPADSGFLIPDSIKNTSSGKPDPAPTDPDSPEGLIGYLNAKAGKRFRPVEANARLVRARLAEATADEIRRVIDARCAKWRGDPKMAEYLRPSTLFGREKFAQYLGEIDAPSATKDAKWWVQRGYGDEAMARRDGHVPPWEEAA